jgi:hypothetical protein
MYTLHCNYLRRLTAQLVNHNALQYVELACLTRVIFRLEKSLLPLQLIVTGSDITTLMVRQSKVEQRVQLSR